MVASVKPAECSRATWGVWAVALGIALLGTLTALFEQVDRRAEENRLRTRTRRGRS